MQMEEQTVRRPGSSEDTLPTPEDFPEGYDYGTGRIGDWDFSANYRRLPEPEENLTVLSAEPDTSRIQALYLWEEGNVPAQTVEPENMAGYFDPPGFRPYLTAIPVPEGTEVKGAVVLLAGGAFAFRGNFTDALPTAAHLRELGYQTFIVDYRLRPYTQEEGALDVARAVRFIRKNADAYGIDPDDIAVMGYSAGGIQAGEFFLHYDGAVNGRISDWCRRRGVPVNVVDDREKCTFFFPALVKEGALTVGISTDGKCPAASAFLREQVVRCLPEGIGAVIDLLGQLRPEVAEGIDRQNDRAQAMEKLFLYSLRRGGEVTLQELRDLLHGMRQEGRRDG